MDKKLAKNLERGLLKVRYNQGELGRIIGIQNKSYMSQIVNGLRPMPEYAQTALAEYVAKPKADQPKKGFDLLV